MAAQTQLSWMRGYAIVYLCLLGIIKLTTQDQDRLEGLRRRCRDFPGNVQALADLAGFLHQQDHAHPDGGSRIPEAEKAYRDAIAAAPNKFAQCILLGNLGALLLSVGRMAEALTTLDQSVQVGLSIGNVAQANIAGALFNKGKVLSSIGEDAEAQQAYHSAFVLAEGKAGSTWTKCAAAMKQHSAGERSKMEEAAAAFDKQRGHKHGSRSSKTFSSSEWRWLEGTSLQDQSWLYFALYKAYEAEGSVAEAWSVLSVANSLQKQDSGYSGNQERQLLSALKAVFPLPSEQPVKSAAYEALLNGQAGFPDSTAVFIVGMPRSGSTLVEQILASHPGVVGAGEDTALAPLIPRLVSVLENLQGGAVGTDQVAAVGQTYVDAMRTRISSGQAPKRIVDKMLRNAWNVGYIFLMLPKARIVWTVRHPLDVALSCFAQPFEGRGTPWAWSLDDIADQMEMTHEIMRHWESLFPGRVFRLTLEQLIADQERVTKQLLSFCGLSWDPAVVRFYETKRLVTTASQSQIRSGLSNSSVGRWMRYRQQLQGLQIRLQPLILEFEKLQKSSRPTRDELR